MDRLVILDPPNVTIRFEVGRKSVGRLQLKNVMHTMPIAFKMQSSVPKKYSFKPAHAIIAPLGVVSVDVIINAQNELPDSFPLCLDLFTVKSVVLPGGYQSRSTVSPEWFNGQKAVYSDTGLKLTLIGGGILRDLVKRGWMDAVRNALEEDPTLADSTDEQGQTAMHVAISIQRPEMVQLLLEFKVNLELRNKAGQTPLQQASIAGEALIAELLLANGADTETRIQSGRQTSLHLATIKGHDDVMQLLIDHGADLEATTLDGRTAIHIAVAEGQKHCLKLLLDNGCNVDAQSLDGGTALHMASARGHIAFVNLLLDKGANKDLRNCQGRTPCDEAVESGHLLLYDLLFLGEDLRQSTRTGDLKRVKRAFRKGAIVGGGDQYGWTALHRAAFKGHTNVVKYLVARGADVNQKDEEGYTALHAAVESGQKDVVKLLLSKGADVLEKTKGGLTPLRLAATSKHFEIARILVEGGSSSKDALSSLDHESPELLTDIISKGRYGATTETALTYQPYNIEKYLKPVTFNSPNRNNNFSGELISKGILSANLQSMLQILR